MVGDEDITIDVALARRLVDAQFPSWLGLPIRAVASQGWDNRSFRLGDDFFVRLPSAEHYSGQVEKEQRWLPWLGPRLPLPVPAPVAQGEASEDYPWAWSVYQWIPGETASVDRISGMDAFAEDLGGFLNCLQRLESADGPVPGQHNFYCGGPITHYEHETDEAIARLDGQIGTEAVREIWEAAKTSKWSGAPRWFHGDVAEGNLLVQSGRLSAVIDFGCSGVGDSGCDLTIAWTFFSGTSRTRFRETLSADGGMWARAQGWALWKALIIVAEIAGADASKKEQAWRVLKDLLDEYRQ